MLKVKVYFDIMNTKILHDKLEHKRSSLSPIWTRVCFVEVTSLCGWFKDWEIIVETGDNGVECVW